MQDAASVLLMSFLQHPQGSTLWIADENSSSDIGSVMPSSKLTIICNRIDIVESAIKTGHRASFADFDFSTLLPGSFQRIVYRISKEKAVVHHILNSAWSLLATGGELVIAGLKNEGIKTFIDKCKQVYGNGNAEKHRTAYLGRFCKSKDAMCAGPLDDQDYSLLRLIQTPTLDYYSKPGIFGWDKIDQGSAFLLEHLPDCLAQLPVAPQSMLDLGCGYGYLTLMTRNLALSKRTATDNNAAAVLAMNKNASHYCMNVEVVASDAGASLSSCYDLILCNPPFHQGFSIDGCLTEKFLHQCRRLLSPNGIALFVVNAFIGLEKQAISQHLTVIPVANNQSFKVILLRTR